MARARARNNYAHASTRFPVVGGLSECVAKIVA